MGNLRTWLQKNELGIPTSSWVITTILSDKVPTDGMAQNVNSSKK
jgi:hypothetical protein